MPNNVFTRDFIVQRIQTRVAEIREQVTAAGAAIERLRKKQAKGDRTWLAAIHGKMVALAVRAEEAGSLEGADLVEATTAIEDSLRKMYHQPPRNSLTYDEQGELRSLLLENKKLSDELAALEQVLVYLTDHPVQEWSIAALQKIGILQVVKFRLQEKK